MNLKHTSILFIVLLTLALLWANDTSVGRSWGYVLPILILLLLSFSYLIFWVVGNIKLLTQHKKPNRKWLALLLNFPLLVILFIILVNYAQDQQPNMAVTLNVLDPQGQPVADAEVMFNWSLKPEHQVLKHTDEAGQLYRQYGPIFNTRISQFMRIRKAGFHPSYGYVAMLYNQIDDRRSVGTWPFRHWQPWNPQLNIVLKPVENPVPLHARALKLNLQMGADYALDMLAGDWVAPLGKGKVADLVFTHQGEDSYTITLPGQGNGIQLFEADLNNYSALKLPRHAPLDEYTDKLTMNLWKSWPGQKEEQRRQRANYFFKIRNTGASDSAGPLYGKIYAPLALYYDERIKTHQVSFMYFLNPNPGDTNLEFDADHNLASDHGITKYSSMRWMR